MTKKYDKNAIKATRHAMEGNYLDFRRTITNSLNNLATKKYSEMKTMVANKMFNEGTYATEKLSKDEEDFLDQHDVEERDEDNNVVKNRKVHKNDPMKKGKDLSEQKKMKDDPCWDDHEMVGTKKKKGKEVPNCVPKNEGFFGKKKKDGPSDQRMKQATTPKGEKKDAEEWGGKDYFGYRKANKKDK